VEEMLLIYKKIKNLAFEMVNPLDARRGLAYLALIARL
jgi:hypothetical protein